MRQATLVATALLKLGVFGAGAYLSVRGVRGPSQFFGFSVGAIFGAVVLVWRIGSGREWINLRTLGFLASSTLIWIVVFKLIITSISSSSDVIGTNKIITRVYEVVRFYGPISLGTILLTITHASLLKAPLRRVLGAISCVLGIWFLGLWYLSYSVFAVSNYPTGSDCVNLRCLSGVFAAIDALQYSIPVWQGAYLLCMFGSIPQFVKTRFRLSRKT